MRRSDRGIPGTMPIDDEYVDNLAEIYRDVLGAYPAFDSTRKVGYGLSYQSLYSALEGKYTIGQIMTACENMAEVDLMVISNRIFACPTALGEELIAAITGDTVPESDVPPIERP